MAVSRFQTRHIQWMENTNDLVPVSSIPSPAIISTTLAGANISLVPFCLRCLPAFCLFFFATRLFSRSLLRHFFILQTVGTQSETIYKTLTKHQAEPISTTLTVCCSQTHGIRAQLQHPTWTPEDFSSPDFVRATLSFRAGICISQRLQLQLRTCERGIGTHKRTTTTVTASLHPLHLAL